MANTRLPALMYSPGPDEDAQSPERILSLLGVSCSRNIRLAQGGAWLFVDCCFVPSPLPARCALVGAQQAEVILTHAERHQSPTSTAA
jgi:hypothetical protein